MRKWIVAAALASTAALATARAAESAALRVPVPDAVDRLGDIFPGHDIAALFYAGIKLEPKRDLESTAEYEARMGSETARPVYGAVSLSDRVSVVTEARTSARAASGAPYYKYDADTEKLSVCLPSDGRMYLGLQRLAANFAVLDFTKPGKTYIATNAFGARTKVRQEYRGVLAVAVPRKGKGLAAECGTTITLPLERARALLPLAQIALVGRPVVSMFASESRIDGATISNPVDVATKTNTIVIDAVELYLFTPSTGEIFYRAQR